MKSDTEIIRACLSGQQKAFKQLYEKYLAYCYGICTRYAVHQSDIKDLIQVVFSQVFQSLKNYNPQQAQFKTWLTRVCINHILSYKKKQTKTAQTLYVADFHESLIHSSDNSIDKQIDRQHILSLIKQMPRNYQIVFNMFIIDGYTHEEIAQRLNISVASSRVTLNRARTWVKKTLVNKH
ncbi:MAG: sigma-70 family RNA polymerase sigma factor [Bacteroidota bacterium]